MSNQHCSVWLLIAICLCIGGCTPHDDPLASWKGIGGFDVAPVPDAIKQDAMAYFQTLGPIERAAATMNSSLYYMEDGQGSHAVVLAASHDGERWHYAVLYGPDNRRIKVLKYSLGGYMS
ncbi:MAG: hypothetical protein INR62_05175 [Rhodospirillales bacterium]|nr:hypothetical protein [Acetobacter sp.]